MIPSAHAIFVTPGVVGHCDQRFRHAFLALAMPTPPILVRRARPADAADFARMMGEDSVYRNLLQLPMPSEELWRKRLEVMADPDRPDLQLAAELGGRVVGSAGLHPAHPLRRRHVAMMGISVVAESTAPTPCATGSLPTFMP